MVQGETRVFHIFFGAYLAQSAYSLVHVLHPQARDSLFLLLFFKGLKTTLQLFRGSLRDVAPSHSWSQRFFFGSGQEGGLSLAARGGGPAGWDCQRASSVFLDSDGAPKMWATPWRQG